MLKTIDSTFDRFGISREFSPTIETDLAEYVREDRIFADFSQAAKAIWANEVTPAEFRDFVNVVHEELPGRVLYDKQLLAALHLAFSQNACNFSVPGSGKTSVVYGAFAYLSSLAADHPKHVNKILVIGPLSSFRPWEKEFEDCFGRRPRSQRLSGEVPDRVRVHHLVSSAPEVTARELTLLTYQGLPSLFDYLVEYLRKPENHVMVVLDEAHRIKNTEGGVWSTAALALAKYCRARVVLTGTPAPNGYEDLYNLFRFIWPNRNVIGFAPGHLAEMTENRRDKRISELVGNLSPYFVRITKADLAIPPATEHAPIVVPMGPRQREIYDYIEDRYLGPVLDTPLDRLVRDRLAQAKLIRLMQAASNPALLTGPISEIESSVDSSVDLFVDESEIASKIMSFSEVEQPAKIRALIDLVSPKVQAGQKVIVWAVYIKNLHDIREAFISEGIQAELLYGATPTADESTKSEVEFESTRESIIERFHEEDCPYRVLVANPFAVGESISLHKACHTAVYFERNFSAGALLQSKDRIHRYGLTSDDETHYYYLVSENSIDETIDRRLEEKVDAMMQIIESREIPLLSLNMDYRDDLKDDFKAVLRDYVDRSPKASS
ncbi:DEAD/DEAH box helicase [Lentisalinibacter salinarum]|uniref:DEAD/DEAH box helicase n=1 Tax=Lentisalinibacter salinarum TaxID=2992239 RepID=UPI003867243A